MSPLDARMALRPESGGHLDDVYVKDVEMFRLERMSGDRWWACCYFPGSEERLTFSIYRQGKYVYADVTEFPVGDEFTFEPGSIES